MQEELIKWIQGYLDSKAETVTVLMVSGAQGIGKSTALKAAKAHFGDQIAILGLDDFYLTKAEREALAESVHPLFATRGPPGTHDIKYLESVIYSLSTADSGSQTRLPVFDKKTDDRAPLKDWPVFIGRPQIIILEGWLIGALPDTASPESDPLNRIEAQDSEGFWRRYQEEKLAGPYSNLWDKAAGFLHLMGPCFETVLSWRIQQEETTLGLPAGALPPEKREWVQGFILHYERLTRRMLRGSVRHGLCLCVDDGRQLKLAFETDPETPPLIVFSDLDGTLLDHSTYSFDAAIPALNRLHACGAVLVLASSKTAAEIKGLRAAMGFSHCPAIVENGAGILPPESAEESASEAENVYDKLLTILDQVQEPVRNGFVSFRDWSVEDISAMTGLSLKAAALARQRKFSEPGQWRGDEAGLAAFLGALADKGIHARQGGRFLTLSFGSTKANRMAEIIELYTAGRAVPPTLALGDAPNDAEMISTADYGVVIANSHGAPLPDLAGEATGGIIRTKLEGPAGWANAVLAVLRKIFDKVQLDKM